MADVDYLRYAQYMGARNPLATGMNEIGETIDSNRRLRTLESENARRNALTDLQMQKTQMDITDTQAQQQGGMAATGAGSLAEMYKQQQIVKQTAAQQEQKIKVMTFANTTLQRYSDAVKDGTMSPEKASEGFQASMAQVGVDFAKQGMSIEFKGAQPLYSGPVKADALVSVNGKVMPYGNLGGGEGIAEKWNIVGVDPQSQKPIFQIGTFKEQRPESKGFDQTDLNDRVLITPRDGSKPYYLKKGITPKADSDGTDSKADLKSYQQRAAKVRELDTIAAKGFKGQFILDGVVHSYDGSQEAQKAISSLSEALKRDLTSNPTYSGFVKRYDPQWAKKTNAEPLTATETKVVNGLPYFKASDGNWYEGPR